MLGRTKTMKKATNVGGQNDGQATGGPCPCAPGLSEVPAARSNAILASAGIQMTEKEANLIVGGLSEPSILPGRSWNISREHCITGRRLREIPGTVCKECYAKGGKYNCPLPQAAMTRRYERMYGHRWVDAMACLLQPERLFRWFDIGDVQSVRHLERVAEVCRRTPGCQHWLATRERGIVRAYLRDNAVPDNLNIRISADFIDSPETRSPIAGCTLATVTRRGFAEGAHNCPISFGGWDVKGCADVGCYACWDKTVHHINYKKH